MARGWRGHVLPPRIAPRGHNQSWSTAPSGRSCPAKAWYGRPRSGTWQQRPNLSPARPFRGVRRRLLEAIGRRASLSRQGGKDDLRASVVSWSDAIAHAWLLTTATRRARPSVERRLWVARSPSHFEVHGPTLSSQSCVQRAAAHGGQCLASSRRPSVAACGAQVIQAVPRAATLLSDRSDQGRRLHILPTGQPRWKAVGGRRQF